MVLTFGVYEMGSRPIPNGDIENLSGTMVKKVPPGQQGELLDTVHFDTAQFNGLVELRNTDDMFSLDVRLNSEDPMEVVEALAPWAHAVHLKDVALAPHDDGFLLAEAALGGGILDIPAMVREKLASGLWTGKVRSTPE